MGGVRPPEPVSHEGRSQSLTFTSTSSRSWRLTAGAARREFPLPSRGGALGLTPDPDIRIRRATPDDAPTLGRLGALLVKTHHEFDPKRFIAPTSGTARGYGSFLVSQLGDPDIAVLVAEESGKVIGYSYAGVEDYDWMALRGPAGVLHDIIVDPERRGRGAGRLLLDATLEFLRSRGAPRVVLWTAARNATAQRLFESAGFRDTMTEMTRELDEPQP